MAKETLHVVPHDDTWAVKREGNERVSSTHATQKDAIDAARGLAKDGDALVIHRPDGTIREQTTYTAHAAEQNGQSTSAPSLAAVQNDLGGSSPLRPRDVMSVGTRVRWGAVFAGVAVALAVYVTLNLFAFAIGISTFDQMGTRSFAVGAAVVSTFCLLVALFVGGMVASRCTVGEQTTEAMTYGVLVWSTAVLLLVATGLGLGVGFFAGVRDLGKSGAPAAMAEATRQGLNPTGQQAERSAAALQGGEGLAAQVSPVTLAWWTFGGVVLSILTAVGGAVVGAGPELILKRFRENRIDVLTSPA